MPCCDRSNQFSPESPFFNMAAHPAPKIAPSILSSDFARLGEETQLMLDYGADTIHVDVMDGHFVPNLTLGAPIVTSLRKFVGPAPFLDCHLMVSNPGQWIADFKKAGASGYTVHVEAFKSQQDGVSVLKEIRESGMKVGLALKPETPLSDALPYLNDSLVDMLLVMTVRPGFGGQSFMPETMPKLKEARQLFPNLDIQVDGGLSPETIGEAAKNGANVIVAGSAVYGSKDPKGVIQQLRDAVLQANA
jgi:ribulose-phosphate 3-epimerase